jgi:hypothetical protein
MLNPLRRVPVLALALTCLATAATAQGAGTRFGIFGGAAMSKLSGPALDDIENVKSRLGLHAGIFLELGLSRNVAIQPEVAYAMRGVKLMEGTTDITFQADWVEVPLLLKLAFPSNSGSNVRPHLYAGPAVAFKMGCTAKGEEGNVSVSVDCEEFEAVLKGTDFGLVVGGGLDLGRLMLGARYTIGMTNLNDGENLSSDEEFKSRSISFLVGYALRLNGR